ncbi:MAG: hypothetical protein K1X87_06920 [Dehalococcoidia bacterium]|nr:hypothetical protein [Dehalococcoidia bacterium]
MGAAPVDTARGHEAARSRARWLAAWGLDLLTLLAALAGCGLLAIVWMLVRTDRGRYDLGTWDAIGALSLCAAAAPAWSAWQWLRLRDRGVTFGGREPSQPGEAAPASTSRRALLAALHPAMLPLWLWVTAMLMTTGIAALAFVAVLPFTMFLTGALLMLGSMAMLLARPSAAPLHEWFARASFGGGR